MNQNQVVTTNNQSDLVAQQTPIEIALQIDEQGMTTASALYAFLELDPSNFARWCKQKIVNCTWLAEGSDYEVIISNYNNCNKHSLEAFVINDERTDTGIAGNPHPKTDYLLTADCAKRLAMTCNSERGEEARQYFLACEQGMKVGWIKIQELANTVAKLQEQVQDAFRIMQENYDCLNGKIDVIDSGIGRVSKQEAIWYHDMQSDLAELADQIRGESNMGQYAWLIDEMMPYIESQVGSYNHYADDYMRINDLKKRPYRLQVLAHYDELWPAVVYAYNKICRKYNIPNEANDREDAKWIEKNRGWIEYEEQREREEEEKRRKYDDDEDNDD